MRTACYIYILKRDIKEMEKMIELISSLREELYDIKVIGGNHNQIDWNKWIQECKDWIYYKTCIKMERNLCF